MFTNIPKGTPIILLFKLVLYLCFPSEKGQALPHLWLTTVVILSLLPWQYHEKELPALPVKVGAWSHCVGDQQCSWEPGYECGHHYLVKQRKIFSFKLVNIVNIFVSTTKLTQIRKKRGQEALHNSTDQFFATHIVSYSLILSQYILFFFHKSYFLGESSSLPEKEHVLL